MCIHSKISERTQDVKSDVDRRSQPPLYERIPKTPYCIGKAHSVSQNHTTCLRCINDRPGTLRSVRACPVRSRDQLQQDALLRLLRSGLERGNNRLESTCVSRCDDAGCGATLTSSKTSLSLYCVRAEHSTYFTAPSSLAIRSPSSLRIGCIFWRASFSRTAGSSRRSVWVPTIRQGTPGQWWCTSGNHFSRTFSKEAGEVTEKQTRKTSV